MTEKKGGGFSVAVILVIALALLGCVGVISYRQAHPACNPNVCSTPGQR